MGGPGRFGAVLTAMVTPFDAAGALDLDGAATLARWLADHGSDGLVVAGTTGEAPTLTDAEKADLWRAVKEAVTVPVVAGSTSFDTAHSVRMTQVAADAGVDGILAVTPYYNRPSQAGIAAHFRAVAAASDLPVLLYDIPVRTGRKIGHDVIIELCADVPTIVGVKDAASDPAASAWLLAQAPSIELYGGNDVDTLALLAVGACGTISVASHWTGALQQRLCESFWKGDVDQAREINARLLPSFRYETGDDWPNPIPTKAICRVLGLPSGQCRLPIGPAPEGQEDRARAILDALGSGLGTGA